MNANERWEKGVPHDPRSKEIYRLISEADELHGGDTFGWKSGGDGDNGETLMFALDCYFSDEPLSDDEKRDRFAKEITALLDKHDACFGGIIHDSITFYLRGLNKPLVPIPDLAAEPIEEWMRRRLTSNLNVETTMSMFRRKLKERDEKNRVRVPQLEAVLQEWKNWWDEVGNGQKGAIYQRTVAALVAPITG